MSRRHLYWIALACCGHPDPHIKSFHVTPTGYCPSGDQKIRVDWDTAKGKTTLQIAPDDAAPREVAARGELEFPAHDAVVTIAVSDGAIRPRVIQPVRAVDRHSLN